MSRAGVTRPETEAMYRLDNQVQNYAWGSTSTIPALLGVEATGEPVAELWLGAHPAAPSRVVHADDVRTLTELLEQHPDELLGRAVAERFGGLPFLLKVLAVDHPLSLQAHPSLEQARAGFAAENASGLPIDAPTRNYRDANHKPELVCALTEFEGLCGFRPVAETARFLDALDTPALSVLRERLVGENGLREVVTDVLTRPSPAVEEILRELVPAAARVARDGADWADEAGWIVRLDGKHPGDRGTVVAMLLNLFRLEPGQAVFLHAGVLHAYLRGVAVEVLANSDNVLRGGLTPKHIDVASLLDILEFDQARVEVVAGVTGTSGESSYPSTVADFRLSRLDLSRRSPSAALGAGTPRVLLCTSGSVQLTPNDPSGTQTPLTLPQGGGAFVSAGTAIVARSSDGQAATVFVAAPNL